MARYGGTVKLRTAPGEGTEVQLTMPRTTAQANPGPVNRAKPMRPKSRLRDRIGGKGTGKADAGDTGDNVGATTNTVKESR
jgi:hypothetical protein